MKVILTKDVSGLGRSGDVKEVSDGHARNFLMPRHLALPATSAALAKIQKEEQERQTKLLKDQEKLSALKIKLEGKTFSIKAKSDKEHLFAAIRPEQVANSINQQLNLEITNNQVLIDKPIKTKGLHEVHIRLAQNIIAHVNLNIETS